MQTHGSIDPESLIGQTFYKGIYTIEQLVDVGVSAVDSLEPDLAVRADVVDELN